MQPAVIQKHKKNILYLLIFFMLLLLSLWKTLSIFPMFSFLILVANAWPIDPFGDNIYWQAVMHNPIGYIVWQNIKWSSEQQWFTLHFLILLFSLFMLGLFFHFELGLQKSTICISLFTSSTIFAVLFGWVGSYDAWTFLGMVTLLHAWKANTVLPLFFVGTYLGFQHIGQSIFLISIALITMRFFGRAIGREMVLALISGLVLGYLLNRHFIQVADQRSHLNLATFLSWGFWKVQGLPYYVYSILGPLVLLVIYDDELHRLRCNPYVRSLIIAILISIIPAVITNEPTRPTVFAIFIPLIWWISDFVSYHKLTWASLSVKPLAYLLFLLPPIVQFDGNNLQIGIRNFTGAWLSWHGINVPVLK